MDLSSELVHALLPVFLVTTMGMSVTAVGVLEGAANACSRQSLLKYKTRCSLTSLEPKSRGAETPFRNSILRATKILSDSDD
jgi:hypothetical protein